MGHTFYVGDLKTWVHNTGTCALPPGFFGSEGLAVNGVCEVAITGETASTSLGKRVHKTQADLRRESGLLSTVEQAIADQFGNPILVPKRVDLKTGEAQPGANFQKAIPDAANFDRRLIVDDKPLGRPIAKDRHEIIRFIEAFRQREGVLPETIGIQRYAPKTGLPGKTELYSPYDFLPKK
ncbi:hypothetical protein [Pseudomonas trivialis]|uniref:Uncharacterized protein n=1 Tax=Pseudomonas trivialis TaxID=200450 RepID=A0A0R2ZDB2_9PSED|nr:hypothetical protein [Pseudomonas trivialis]KRP58125.1 hypothetical protein TU79_21740 [Pseudomonas trivialis]SDS12790.1 hypothetical protein SAMN04490205_1556 [Pseudomonas trivialis]